MGELRGEPRRGGRKDAGKGAASDALMGSSGEEGAHTRLPAQVVVFPGAGFTTT